MDIKHHTERDLCSISLKGQFINKGTVEFQNFIEPILKNDQIKFILINLKEVNLIDSSALGKLVWLLKSLKSKGGKLALYNLRGKHLNILEMTRLDTTFPIYSTQEEALKKLK